MAKRRKGNGSALARRKFYARPSSDCANCMGSGLVCSCCGTNRNHQAGTRDCDCLYLLMDKNNLAKICDGAQLYFVRLAKRALTQEEWFELVGYKFGNNYGPV